MSSNDRCEHLKNFDAERLKIPGEPMVCRQCIEKGDTWVHLRICQTCGEVSCCNSSKNKHATKHFLSTGHPLIISAEKGERWAWCYEHEQFMKY